MRPSKRLCGHRTVNGCAITEFGEHKITSTAIVPIILYTSIHKYLNTKIFCVGNFRAWAKNGTRLPEVYTQYGEVSVVSPPREREGVATRD